MIKKSDKHFFKGFLSTKKHKALCALLILAIYAFRVIQVKTSPQQAVLGENTRVVSLSVDYNQEINVGSPLVFGGVHAPSADHLDMWQVLANTGINLVRSDFFLEFCSPPRTTTIDDYKNNVNNIQDIQNWPATCQKNVSDIYSYASNLNMKVVAIVAYIPPWLSDTGTDRGMPKDWDIYDDIVEKMYRKNRDNIDYIEVWNEPDHKSFLVVKDSSIPKEKAYAMLYEHVSKIIKKVDAEANDGKQTLIGGPAISNPSKLSYVEEILTNPNTKDNVDFISIHSYEDGITPVYNLKTLLKKLHFEHIPIYVSEWNKNGSSKEKEFNVSYKAVTYTASRLIEFLNNGVDMASYFSLRENNPKGSREELQSYGFYKKQGSSYTLLPQSMVWNMLSKSLGLGSGQSVIYSTQNSDYSQSLGFRNSLSEYGFVVINKNSRATAEFKAYNYPYQNSPLNIRLSLISEESGFERDLCNEIYRPDLGPISFKFDLPANSVVSVLFEPHKNSVSDLLKILAITTTKDCIVFE